MLLHDSYFHYSNRSINSTHFDAITIAYSPLFHSTFTLYISIFGLLFNLICCIKIWYIIYQNRQRKLNNIQQNAESVHILSHNKYRFLIILTSNDFLLCLASIISCLDERYFFQSLLARYHLCAAHVLLWKFTLHFTPLLIIFILYRYHYMLNKKLQMKSSNLSALNQVLCTDLSIIIPFVLALAWSVDGLWLWGVANIKDYINPPSSLMDENKYRNDTVEILTSNTTLTDLNIPVGKLEEQNDNNLFLPEQKTICYLQTNHNIDFTVRLVHLIQADFLLLTFLHLIGLILEIFLHIRVCCCLILKKVTSSSNHERQLCIYILYIFLILTLTSLPFYFYRTIEIIFDTQLTTINNDLINSRTFAQILLLGACFKPILFCISFFPSSVLFKFKFYLKCYSPTNIQIVEQDEHKQLTSINNKKQYKEPKPITRSPHHRYSLFMHPSRYSKFRTKLRTQSNPIIPIYNHRQSSVANSEHYNSWLKLANSVVVKNPNETSNMEFI